jgi:hypothetical protein
MEKLSAPFSFRLRMFLAATAICLLPALYAVLVTLFLGGAVMWFLYAPSIVGSGAVLLYGPSAVLLVIGLALLKPLVAPRPTKGKTKSLAQDKAPLLFELVDKIASILNADAPKQITVDGNTTRTVQNRPCSSACLAASCTVDQLRA